MLSHDNVGRQSFSMYIYINVFTSPHIAQQLVYEVIYRTSLIHLFKIWKHVNNKRIWWNLMDKFETFHPFWNLTDNFCETKKDVKSIILLQGFWLLGWLGSSLCKSHSECCSHDHFINTENLLGQSVFWWSSLNVPRWFVLTHKSLMENYEIYWGTF